jgi:hypothetical protein
VRHRAADRTAALRGLVLVAALLVPAAVVRAAAATTAASSPDDYARAAAGMLVVLAPYAVVVLLALAAYGVLGWRQKYLASAMILGPFTLVRPVVALVAALCGAWRGGAVDVVVVIALGTIAVLAVEPLAGRLWYAPDARLRSVT